jgi:hypothetical protein
MKDSNLRPKHPPIAGDSIGIDVKMGVSALTQIPKNNGDFCENIFA